VKPEGVNTEDYNAFGNCKGLLRRRKREKIINSLSEARRPTAGAMRIVHLHNNLKEIVFR